MVVFLMPLLLELSVFLILAYRHRHFSESRFSTRTARITKREPEWKAVRLTADTTIGSKREIEKRWFAMAMIAAIIGCLLVLFLGFYLLYRFVINRATGRRTPP